MINIKLESPVVEKQAFAEGENVGLQPAHHPPSLRLGSYRRQQRDKSLFYLTAVRCLKRWSGDFSGCGVTVARVLWEDLVRVQISAPRLRD